METPEYFAWQNYMVIATLMQDTNPRMTFLG